MEEQLIKILKELKGIKPEEGFVKRSRQLVLASPIKARGFLGLKMNFLESFKLAAALTLASALLFVLLGGFSYLNLKNLSPMGLTSLNAENLKAEAEKLDFQIQLGEAVYNINSDKEVGLKIDELLKNLSL